MSELRKATSDYPYFLTFTLVGWIDIFTRRLYCDIIIENLAYCIKNRGLELYAYVVMPSHIHLVARSNSRQLSNIIRDFKSNSARRIIKSIKYDPGESRKNWLLHMFRYYSKFQKQNPRYMFWQKTNHPTVLDYARIIDQKIEYIHNNPVASGLINDISAWNYSSANPYQRLDLGVL